MATQTQSALLEAQGRISRYRAERLAESNAASASAVIARSASNHRVPPRKDSVHRPKVRSRPPAEYHVTTQVPPRPSMPHPTRQSSKSTREAMQRGSYARNRQMHLQSVAQAPVPQAFYQDGQFPPELMARTHSSNRYRKQPIQVTTQIPPRPSIVQATQPIPDGVVQAPQPMPNGIVQWPQQMDSGIVQAPQPMPNGFAQRQQIDPQRSPVDAASPLDEYLDSPQYIQSEPEDSIQRSKSRYRRRNIPVATEPPLPSPPVEADAALQASEEAILRSKSRYRKASPVLPQQNPPQNIKRVLTDPQIVNTQQRMVPNYHSDPRLVSNDRALRREMSLDSLTRNAPPVVVNRPLRAKTSAEAQAIYIQRQQIQMAQAQQAQAQNARAEARQLLDNEAERQRRLTIKLKAQKEKQKAEEERQRLEQDRQKAEEDRVKALEAENARLKRREEERILEAQRQKEAEKEAERMAEAKRQRNDERAAEVLRRREAKGKEAERQQAELDHKQRSRDIDHAKFDLHTNALNSSNAPSSPTSGGSNRFAFLKKRKGDDAPTSSDIPARSKSARDRDNGPPLTIRPGGGGVVPGTDAPISAVNAGERRVMIECENTSILLPVTPTTTPRDLIRSAATCLTVQIEPKTSVMLESFGKVGVQRPLRNYEHVRDVMNSWDDDRQNTLVIVPSATGGNDPDLEADSISTEQPPETSCYLLLSQQPGKWEKRWVTLRPDGQVLHSKKEGAKDGTNICHMSDFDIYSPTREELGKKIRPPKKLCFAIKSQQKSSIFLATTNFVHFFATGDKKTAATWYKAVQSWRSWYLVNIMGEGRKGPPKPSTDEYGRPGSRDSHYQLGSFKPLIDMEDFGIGLGSKDTEPSTETSFLHRNMSVRARQGPPSSFPKHLANEANGTSSHDRGISNSNSLGDDSMFASTGLLGRSYSQRQKTQREREAARISGPFINGPSLLNDIDTSAAVKMSLDIQGPWTGDHTTTSHHAHKSSTQQSSRSRAPSMKDGVRPSVDLKRGASTSRKPQPLVDLTPRYQEPPQHARKAMPQTGSGPLIDAATSPENAIAIPPTSDWRARPSTDVSRSRSVRGATSGDDAEDSSGLAAIGAAGQGTARAGRPMLNSTKPPSSKFAVGSLLERVWKEKLGRDGQGERIATKGVDIDSGPIIDRSRATEVKVETGEGL